MSPAVHFKPGGHGRDSVATIQLEGVHDIFRFAVNMLGHQIEFGAAGRTILVELREHMTSERFDPMARSLLGEDRYGRLKDRFERDDYCVACDAAIKPGDLYAAIKDAKALCAECADEDPYLTAPLVKAVTR